MKVTFSVIIPSYNSAAFIAEGVESVLAQTCTDFELIVVDDGSSDNIAEVLAPYSDQLTFVQQSNAGSAAARNHGIRLAKGACIAFLDADDLWMPDKLERQLVCFANHPEAGMVYGPHLRVEKDGIERPSRREALPSGQIFAELFFKNWVATSSVVLTRETVETVGVFDESLRRAQDHDLWLRVAHAYPCYALDWPVVKFRARDGSASTDREPLHACVIRIIEKAYENYKDAPPVVTEPMYRTKMADQHVKMARSLLRRGEPKQARRMAATALKYRPLSAAALSGYLKTFLGSTHE